MRRLSVLLFAVFALAGTGATVLVVSSAALASGGGTTYAPETPVIDTIAGGPWSTSTICRRMPTRQ